MPLLLLFSCSLLYHKIFKWDTPLKSGGPAFCGATMCIGWTGYAPAKRSRLMQPRLVRHRESPQESGRQLQAQLARTMQAKLPLIPLNQGNFCVFGLCQQFERDAKCTPLELLPAQPISLPGATSPSTVRRRRLPSGSSAQRSMPSETCPAILRGAKLATSTTVLPTRSSGL